MRRLARPFRMSAVRLCAAVLTLVCAAAAASAQPGMTPRLDWTGGNWNGYVWTDPQGGFSLCSIQVGSAAEVDLVLGVSRERGFSMSIVNADWELPVGQTGPISYVVDDGDTISGLGEVHVSRAIRVDLPDESWLVDRFKMGRRLTVASWIGRYEFGLSGSNRAITWLLDCFAQNEVGPGGGAVPLASGSSAIDSLMMTSAGSVQSRSGTAADKRAHFGAPVISPTRAAMVLGSALSFTIDGPFEMRPGESPDTISFASQDVWGRLELLPYDVSLVNPLRGELVGNAAAFCGKVFTMENAEPDPRTDLRMTTQCADENDVRSKEIALLRTASGFALLVVEGPPDPARSTAERLLDELSRRSSDLGG